jgi:hypothetical protein
MEGEGINFVLFDPGATEILDSNLVEVTSVKVGYHSRCFRLNHPLNEYSDREDRDEIAAWSVFAKSRCTILTAAR